MKLRTFIILMTVVVLFIWGHSLVPITSSTEESMSVMKVLQGILDFFNIPVTLTDHFVRKLAHFTEHTAAGLLLGLYIYPWFRDAEDTRMKVEVVLLPLIIGFFIGFVDETIQVFSHRGAAIEDAWLDFFGISFGALAAFVIIWIRNRRKNTAPDDNGTDR